MFPNALFLTVPYGSDIAIAPDNVEGASAQYQDAIGNVHALAARAVVRSLNRVSWLKLSQHYVHVNTIWV